MFNNPFWLGDWLHSEEHFNRYQLYTPYMQQKPKLEVANAAEFWKTEGMSNKYENNPALYGEEENQFKKYVVPNFKENVNFESL
jgi:hypothetical protein